MVEKTTKLTDSDIIKALECCMDDECRGCPIRNPDCLDELPKITLDLINRQKAENEMLNKTLVFEINSAFERGKAEATTEFAERLKYILIINNEENTEVFDYDYTLETIDQIAKELKGESEWGMQKLQQPQGDNDVKCKDCEYLMFSDCYGECRKAYKG